MKYDLKTAEAIKYYLHDKRRNYTDILLTGFEEAIDEVTRFIDNNCLTEEIMMDDASDDTKPEWIEKDYEPKPIFE